MVCVRSLSPFLIRQFISVCCDLVIALTDNNNISININSHEQNHSYIKNIASSKLSKAFSHMQPKPPWRFDSCVLLAECELILPIPI